MSLLWNCNLCERIVLTLDIALLLTYLALKSFWKKNCTYIVQMWWKPVISGN